MSVRCPDKRPTRAEWLVIAWTVIVASLAFGLIGLVRVWTGSPDDPELAGRLEERAVISLALGGFVFVLKEAIQRFLA